MATITATQAISGVQPKGNHNGVDAVRSTITFGTEVVSLSAGDVILWGKVPNGSTLLGIQRGGGATGINTTETFIVGATTLTGSSTSAAIGLYDNAALPFTVSLSDDALGSSNLSAMVKSVIPAVTSGSGTGVLSRTMYLTRDA